MFIIDTSPYRVTRHVKRYCTFAEIKICEKNVTRNSNFLNGVASKGYKLIVLQISDSFLYIVCLSMDLGCLGRAIAQAVSRLLPTASAWVQTRV
jgi:hypothetical protein